NYVSRVFERYGVQQTQKFMRSFYYPGVGHCSGGDAPQPSYTNLFETLVNWVENDVAPDYVTGSQGPTAKHPARSTKICMYPDETVLTGPNPNDQASYSCVRVNREPDDLRRASLTVLERQHGDQGNGHDNNQRGD